MKLIVVFLIIIGTVYASKCPSQDVIYPCNCSKVV